jgi:predicted nuclease of restriction endonuclease-like (RecB) superfamily
MQGLSPRNLGYMRAFAEAWPDQSILQQPVAKLPWGHNVRLLDRVKDREERLWCAEQTIQNGWSRNVLVMQVESGLFRRQRKATTNFQATLPQAAQERNIEHGLLVHLRQFLIELGEGLAFVGSQVLLEVG